MTAIVHWDKCSNFQMTDDQGKNGSHNRVNPKKISFSSHRESSYLFFGGGLLTEFIN